MTKKKAVLSEENQAKLASGIPLEDLDTSADEKTPKPEVNDEEVTEPEANAEKEVVEPEANAEEKEKGGELKTEPESTTTELVSFLKEQNTELQTSNNDMKVELAQLKADNASLDASTTGLEQIVIDACSRLSIGLGHSGADYTHLKGNSLVEQYGTLNKEFCSKFPVGGKVSTESEPSEEISNIHTNRRGAVNSAKV